MESIVELLHIQLQRLFNTIIINKNEVAILWITTPFWVLHPNDFDGSDDKNNHGKNSQPKDFNAPTPHCPTEVSEKKISISYEITINEKSYSFSILIVTISQEDDQKYKTDDNFKDNDRKRVCCIGELIHEYVVKESINTE